MLSSAFTKNNKSVFIDILTLADLEMLKAKKGGGASSNSSALVSTEHNKRSSLKRYAILTYTGEFDRVHYPLPLAFEETPNVLSLQRMIKRLREKLKEKMQEKIAPSSDKERDLRAMISQLRQENQELKHQLRQSSSRNGKQQPQNSSFSSSSSRALVTSSPGDNNQEGAILTQQNHKLKKQLEDTKKQLTDLSFQLERVKVDSAKEIAKWQQKIGSTAGSSAGRGVMTPSASPLSMHSASPKGTASDAHLIIDLKRRLVAMERELKMERLMKGQPTSHNHRSDSRASSRSVTPSSQQDRRALSASRSTRETASRSRSNMRSSSASPLSQRPLPQQTQTQSSKPPRPTSTTRNHPPTAVSANRRFSSPQKSRSLDENDSRSHLQQVSSSSLGKRFDPTAYQEGKRQQQLDKIMRTPSNNNNSSRRYDSPLDSGYSSANSNDSKRSKRSQYSESSGNSKKSNNSQGKKKTKKSSHKNKKATNSATMKVFDDENDFISRRPFPQQKQQQPHQPKIHQEALAKKALQPHHQNHHHQSHSTSHHPSAAVPLHEKPAKGNNLIHEISSALDDMEDFQPSSSTHRQKGSGGLAGMLPKRVVNDENMINYSEKGISRSTHQSKVATKERPNNNNLRDSFENKKNYQYQFSREEYEEEEEEEESSVHENYHHKETKSYHNNNKQNNNNNNPLAKSWETTSSFTNEIFQKSSIKSSNHEEKQQVSLTRRSLQAKKVEEVRKSQSSDVIDGVDMESNPDNSILDLELRMKELSSYLEDCR
jgi:hypothetical protein